MTYKFTCFDALESKLWDLNLMHCNKLESILNGQLQSDLTDILYSDLRTEITDLLATELSKQVNK